MKKIKLTVLACLVLSTTVFSQKGQETPGRKTEPVNTNSNYSGGINLISPANGKLFNNSEGSKPVLFRWSAIMPKPKEPVTYRLRVWQLMQGQNATEAMRSNQPVVSKDVANITQAAISNLYTGPCKPPYLCDYIWNVQVKNREGVGENNVTSEPSSFKIISNEEINPQTIDHQVWENFGVQVRCERLGVTFQAAKKIGVNLYRLFAEFSDIVYYQTTEFVNNHPLPEPNIISYEQLFPVVSDPRLFCDEDGLTISRLNGIWKVTEHNTRNGGSVDLGSIPPVNFSLFTLVNLWNNNHPDNLGNSCRCRLTGGWTSGWQGGSPWIDSLIDAEENRPPEVDSSGGSYWHPDMIIYDSGKIIAISGKDKLNKVRVYIKEARLLELAGVELVNLKITKEEFLKKLNSYLLTGDINQFNTYRRGIIKKDNGVSRDCYTVFCHNPNHPSNCGWQECN